MKIEGASRFKHFLWRRHAVADALGGGFPEVLATDGKKVRRMVSQAKQIIFQEFEDADTSTTLVERIESSVVPGVAMVGYSMFQDSKSVAILHTGQQGVAGGWLAFPDGNASHRPQNYSTLPLQIVDFPKMRIVAGASVAYENRQFIIRAALEQRGSRFAASPSAFHVFEHLSSWGLVGLLMERGQRRELFIGEREVKQDRILRASPTRVEATFQLDALNYKKLRAGGGAVWFKLGFGRDLFALPDEWASFWLRVELIEPPGILF